MSQKKLALKSNKKNFNETDVAEIRSEEKSALAKIVDILKQHTQVNFSNYKMSTVKRRIERQMMLRRIETIEKYAEYLKKNSEEVKTLYEDIFIHVTDFFRDPESFEALKEHVYPFLDNVDAPNSTVRIWVPGCATGEEAYSLAISITEYLETHTPGVALQIFATDISEPAIQKARKGVYADYQIRNISKKRLEKFFDKVKDGYKIKKSIRDICIFSRHDVTINPPIPKVSLISCRNVFIYFSSELQKRIFPVFHYALNPGGFLWLGRAENPGTSSKLFAAVDKTHKIYKKLKSSVPLESNFSTTHIVTERVEPTIKLPHYSVLSSDPLRSVDQMILYRYSPPGVVINGDLEILQFRGRTVPYLEPSPGLANHNLLKMANPDIVTALRVCVQTAKKQNAQVRKENVTLEFDSKKKKINIDVSPVNSSALPKERQYLVIFEDLSEVNSIKTKKKTLQKVKLSKKEKQGQIEALLQHNSQIQQELETSREYQQSLIEEYESVQEELTSSNEELQSTNEELQSTNEELQSSNEELGTAKEELQATNEELLSTNDELQKRNVDIHHALKELEFSERRFRLMIEGVRDYAIFMLDSEGRVASWNEGARRFKGYEAHEIIGKHFSTFYTKEDLDKGKPNMELRVATQVGRFEDEGLRLKKDGSMFWANVIITAIKDDDGNLLGFSKVTRDLTERKSAEKRLKAAHDNLEQRVIEKTSQLEAALKVREEFLSIASHELKTPLTSLLIQAQLRKRNILKQNLEAFTLDKLCEMIDSDEKQLNRLSRLINDMLDVSRLAAGKLILNPEPFDLCMLVREVMERFSEQFTASNCKIELETCNEAIGLLDRFRIEQVIINLFTNAMKYGKGKPIYVNVRLSEKSIILTVRDEGIGIAQKDQDRIFQQFERATNSKVATGFGLGLYIVKQIVEGHRGTIRVESELDKGSTFIVEFPREQKS